jgi:hypothetical protein
VRIPRYWSKATAHDADRHGQPRSITCWRWSDSSQEEAQQSALEAARHALARCLRGDRLNRYGYGQIPLREEVLKSITDAQGQPFMAITRNAYGSLILNTARLAFLDLDFPAATGGSQLKHLLARLLGKRVPSPETQRESEVWGRLQQFVVAHPGYGFRVYRTLAGVRAVATHGLFDPTAAVTQAMLQQLGTDPLYARLCQSQGSFRARLTPKPWRCGCAPVSVPWPREGADQQARFKRWEAEYADCQEGYATCRYLGTVGVDRMDADIQPLIELHDQMTRCEQSLPLA